MATIQQLQEELAEAIRDERTEDAERIQAEYARKVNPMTPYEEMLDREMRHENASRRLPY